MPRYDLKTTTLATLLADPEAVAIVERSYPGASTNPMLGMLKRMTAAKAFDMAVGYVGADEVARIRAELEALA